MKQRIFSLSSLVFAAACLALPMMAFGQSPSTGDANAASPIPAELSATARAQYEAHMKTLRAQIDASKWKEALATVEAMNKERPREPQARFLKTIVLAELGREDEVKQALLALVTDFPELPEPRNNLATLYAKKGEYDLARRELELALASVPDYEIAHANMADLYLQQAVVHYRRAAALNKNSKESRALTARADAVQTLLAPTPQTNTTTAPATDAVAAKEGKETAAAKEGKDATATKEGKDAEEEDDFVITSCKAPSGSGGEDKDDDVFSSGETCELEFDEPEPEKEKGAR